MEDYLVSAFKELHKDDGLLVMAKGIGIEYLFIKFIKLHSISAGKKVVLCLNAMDEVDWIMDALYGEGLPPSDIPKVITSDILSQERSAMYDEGGCIFLTSRIAIHDLLKNVVNISAIAGILVYNAHQIYETSLEEFIIRVFKNSNPNGFVKGFSDDPEAVTNGFGHTERILKNIFVKKLFPWPRFHPEVNAILSNNNQPEVIELSQPFNSSMLAIQGSILVIMDTCLKELKRSVPHLDSTTLNLDNGIFYGFDTAIRKQLDPEWHTISFRAKQLITDIKTLRQLLDYLIRYDAVTFYSYLLTLRTISATQSSPSLWLTSPSGNALFQFSKKRIFNTVNSSDSSTEKGTPVKLVPLFEIPPKWTLLQDILKEISDEYNKLKNSSHSVATDARVVVVVKDERTQSQINEVLINGAEKVLDNRLRHFVTQQAVHIRRNAGTEARKRSRQSNSAGDTTRTWQRKSSKTMADSKAAEALGDEDYSDFALLGSLPLSSSDFESLHIDQQLILTLEQELYRQNSESIDTSTSKDSSGPSSKDKSSSDFNMSASSLDSDLHIEVLTHTQCHDHINKFSVIRPKFIVLFDPDIEIIRMIEIYQSTQTSSNRSCRVYFLMYSESIEEYRYVESLKREKRAFEDLLAKKSNLVISFEDFTVDLSTNNVNNNEDTTSSSITSFLPTKETKLSTKIIVDMREFGSSLPSLLHRSGMQIDPVTLQVGDYILSPQICVERKSISDLFQSFNSGRLYTQLEAMSRHYEFPCLLIEFSSDSTFSLQSHSEITSEIQISNICSKISLLILSFPNITILWSRSPHATVNIFKALKKNFDDPDTSRALTICSDNIADTKKQADVDNNVDIHLIVQNMLLSLPGINTQNYRAVMNNVEDIATLSKMSVMQLTPLIGPGNAKKLFSFFLQSS